MPAAEFYKEVIVTSEPDLAATEQATPRATGGIASLGLFLFLSLLFCLAMGQTIIFNWDTTFGLWLGWNIAWGVIWLVFALLQIRWWASGCEKFWRPIYAWTLFGYIALSLIFLPLLLWPRFRRWLFRVMKPKDPPGWDSSLRALARLRDEGILTPEEFEAKKAEVLGSA